MYRKDNKIYYDWVDYTYDIKQVKDFKFDHVVGIYRGSLPMAVHISNVFDVPLSIVGFQTRDGKDKEPYMIHRKGGLKKDTTKLTVLKIKSLEICLPKKKTSICSGFSTLETT